MRISIFIMLLSLVQTLALATTTDNGSIVANGNYELYQKAGASCGVDFNEQIKDAFLSYAAWENNPRLMPPVRLKFSNIMKNNCNDSLITYYWNSCMEKTV